MRHSILHSMAWIGTAGLGALALIAAQRPSALAGVSGGLWEISSSAGGANATRLCLPDPAALAQYEHRSARCSQTIIADSPSEAVVDYNCAASGFGRTKMTVITPRSMRVETQGISDQAPFHYTLQVRRVGNCPAR